MATSSALLHPVRLRIVQTLLATDGSTTLQLHDRLPDVPIATLYRHIAHLVDHGLIEVVEERSVRGTSEKTYKVAEELTNPTADELASLTPEEILAAFTVFASGVIRDFGDYLDQGVPNLAKDQVSFAQADFWATDTEVEVFSQAVMTALRPLMANTAGHNRRRRALTTIMIPRPVERTTP